MRAIFMPEFEWRCTLPDQIASLGAVRVQSYTREEHETTLDNLDRGVEHEADQLRSPLAPGIVRLNIEKRPGLQ